MKRRAAAVILAGAAMMALPACCPAEAYRYESRGKRDPFVPLLIQGRASASVGLADASTVDDIRLEGIANDAKGRRIAILNGEITREGMTFGAVEVVKIETKAVTIKVGGEQYTVKLFEEGGTEDR